MLDTHGRRSPLDDADARSPTPRRSPAIDSGPRRLRQPGHPAVRRRPRHGHPVEPRRCGSGASPRATLHLLRAVPRLRRARGPRPRAARRRPGARRAGPRPPPHPSGETQLARRTHRRGAAATCCAGCRCRAVQPLRRAPCARLRGRPHHDAGGRSSPSGITLVLCRVWARLPRPHPHRRAARRAAARSAACSSRRHDRGCASSGTRPPGRIQVDEHAHRHARHRERRRRRDAAAAGRGAARPTPSATGPGSSSASSRRVSVRQVEYAVRSHLRGRHPLGPLGVGPAGPVRPDATAFARGRRVRRHRRAAPHRPAGRRPAARATASARRARSPSWSPCTARTTSVDPRVPRRRRPAPHPLAGDRPHRRPHGPPGGPARAAAGDDPARPRARRPPGHGRVELVRVGGHRRAPRSSRTSLGLGYAVHLVCAETVHDGQAAMTTDADHALDVLAEAETGPETELAELVRAAHPVTASGGLVVAILADRDEETLRQVASLRQPGGSGLAIVLDTATLRRRVAADGQPSRPPADAASAVRRAPRRPRRRPPTPSCSTRPAGRSRSPPRATASPTSGRALTTRGVLVGWSPVPSTPSWPPRRPSPPSSASRRSTENARGWTGPSGPVSSWRPSGVLLRRLTSVRLLVLLGQLVVTGWAVVAMFAAGQLWYGLPRPRRRGTGWPSWPPSA